MELLLFDISFHEDQPVSLTAVSFVVAAMIVYLTDPFAMPKRVRQENRLQHSPQRIVVEQLARLPIIMFVYSIFFAISWRPFYSGLGTVSFFVIFTGISRAKYIFIREPLVFSDIALVVDVFKYKSIFYATNFNVLFWIMALSYVFGVSALFMIAEPSIIPSHHTWLWILVGVLVPSLCILMLFVKPIGHVAALVAQWLLRTLNVKSNTTRFGTFTSVSYHFMMWLGMRREAIIEELAKGLQSVIHDFLGEPSRESPLVIFWQSESFMDLRNIGCDDLNLPTIDVLKERAAQWGRLISVFEGGYTLRTEFAVLSGLQPDDVHADASYPYLRASHYADIVWPNKLRKVGWYTHFIHPYDRTFFLRHKAMPIFGFGEMTMLDDFDHVPARDGAYVSDMRLTEKVLEIAEGLEKRQSALLFVASMANHGPWEAGRVEGMSDPIEIYKELLRKADDALARLVAELDKYDRPVWLAFYGDHAPLLKEYADPFPDPRTDYFIVPLARAKESKHVATASRIEAPWTLFETLLWHAHLYKERFK
ncbi:LTA synthase family protein [Agrobacterium tumefaciens]|uniref:LTA synthase family protein n=1 Tax=Agrobacterium tumefaciens TaxID=358 RepID=UPI001572F38E|nr:sulfatase-like hydrolase/transferase [Agrobacterium tumefaciens]NTD13303.1 sulfatase-like hydrolase/transferase [Agrobacterium tumefaciens]